MKSKLFNVKFISSFISVSENKNIFDKLESFNHKLQSNNDSQGTYHAPSRTDQEFLFHLAVTYRNVSIN